MEDNGMAKGLVIGLLAGAVFGVAVGDGFLHSSHPRLRQVHVWALEEVLGLIK